MNPMTSSAPSYSPSKVSPVPRSPASSAQHSTSQKARDAVTADSSEPLFTLVQFLSTTDATVSRAVVPQWNAPQATSFWDASHSSNSHRFRHQSFEGHLYHSEEMHEHMSSDVYSGATGDTQQETDLPKKWMFTGYSAVILRMLPSFLFTLIILTLWISLLLQSWGSAHPIDLPFEVAVDPQGQQVHPHGVYVKRRREVLKGDIFRPSSFTISINQDVKRTVVLNPMKFCVCLDPAKMACDDMSDYIDATRILSVVSLIIEVSLLIFIFNLPRSRRQINGFFLIFSVSLCYCLSMSLASTFQQISSNFCAPMASIWGTSGISIQLRILETIMSGLLVLTSLFHCCRPKTKRSNVMGLKFMMILFNLFSTVCSTFWTGWFVTERTVFGLWAYCTCESSKERCSPGRLYVVCALLLLSVLHVHVIAILARFFSGFFLRFRTRVIWALVFLCATTLVTHAYGILSQTCTLGLTFKLSTSFFSLLLTLLFSSLWGVFVTLQNFGKLDGSISLFVR